MKHFIFAAVFLLVCSAAAYAQNNSVEDHNAAAAHPEATAAVPKHDARYWEERKERSRWQQAHRGEQWDHDKWEQTHGGSQSH